VHEQDGGIKSDGRLRLDQQVENHRYCRSIKSHKLIDHDSDRSPWEELGKVAETAIK
jgi:hypothetical protein